MVTITNSTLLPSSALEEEEDKGKSLMKQKVKMESVVSELEDKLQKEEKVIITSRELLSFTENNFL